VVSVRKTDAPQQIGGDGNWLTHRQMLFPLL
jgi:hypothetical protein